eukprot:GFUD01003233.1.p1 GENE.GFUD01003233.1~~GFUD01003233.1.p1  ORF type:complete len:485 (+),score=82.31 GFUD01003233.1:652-2106(+)
MGVLENDSEVVTIDIIGELYRRGLDVLVEKTVADTDGETIASCFQVCSSWEKHLRNGKVWRRIIERKFAEDINFRLFCRLNGWARILPSQGGREADESEYKQMVYKSTDYEAIWTRNNLNSSKLFTGGLFSCLKLHHHWLFAGMIDGLIKMWDVSLTEFAKKPMRIFEGHEERVSSLDASGSVLVSGSLDHSVRVWNIESSRMLRVLRGSGSPILLVKLLPDRLVWWSRSGTFQIWSWHGPENTEPKLRFKLSEDPDTCNVAVGEHYIAVAPNDVYLNNEREVVIYSSYTGQEMLEKDIFSSAPIQCMDLRSNLLFLGAGCSIEIWDIENSQCVAVLGSNFNPTANLFVRNICVSDFLVVAMLSNGLILHWPLRKLLKINMEKPNTPLHYNMETFAGIIENKEPPWKNIVLSESRIVFGLEMKLGDVKMFNWSNKKVKGKTMDEEDIGVVKRKKMQSRTYQFNCPFECPQCSNVQHDDMEVDLK